MKFELTEEECKLANDWMDEHDKKHGPNKDIIGGDRYTYCFNPYFGGFYAYVQCYLCKEKFTIRDVYI